MAMILMILVILLSIFKPEMRELYALERMWSVKKSLDEKPIIIG